MSIFCIAPTASRTNFIFSAAASGISILNSSSNAIVSSTKSRLSAPRSSVKLASSFTFSGSKSSFSAIKFLTRCSIVFAVTFILSIYNVSNNKVLVNTTNSKIVKSFIAILILEAFFPSLTYI
ncbi:membrane hypothetical protein [Alphaproteobacteria bacterium]